MDSETLVKVSSRLTILSDCNQILVSTQYDILDASFPGIGSSDWVKVFPVWAAIIMRTRLGIGKYVFRFLSRLDLIILHQ